MGGWVGGWVTGEGGEGGGGNRSLVVQGNNSSVVKGNKVEFQVHSQGHL